MDTKIVEKLRRNQLLKKLPDGREAVDVTLQVLGSLAPAPRDKRRQWLRERFSNVKQRLGLKLDMKPDSLSVSGQTVQATVALTEFDDVREELSREGVRVDIMTPMQVIERSSA